MTGIGLEDEIYRYFGQNNFERSRRFGKGKYSTIPLQTALSYYGNPQRKFKSIHVAGTVGKGSVTHYLSQLLNKNGFYAGRYTSPHLLSIHERFSIAEKNIDDYTLCSLWENIQGYPHIKTLSFFDALTLIAFLWFAKRECEWAVVETGLGGKLDSTNVLDSNVAVITTIDIDHVSILGNTIQEIATEKAGIIKSGSQVYLREQSPLAEQALQKKIVACQVNARVFQSTGQQTDSNKDFSIWIFQDYFQKSISPDFQFKPVPGRMEKCHKIPNLLFDSAHNVIGLRYLCKTLQEGWPTGQQMSFYLNCMQERSLLEFANVIYESFPGPNRPELWLFEVDKEGFYAGQNNADLAGIRYSVPEHLVPLWQRPEKLHIVCGSMYLYQPYQKALSLLS